MVHPYLSLKKLLLCYSAFAVGNNESTTTNNAGKLLVIYDKRCIARYITFMASLEPLDAAIQQVPAPYYPGGRHG
jgi:hypothetical protein